MEQSRGDHTLDQPLSVQDQEMFDRVWQRVMAQNGTTDVRPAPPKPSQPPAPPMPEQMPPQTAPLIPARPMPPIHPPAQQEFTCLGPNSLEYAPLLRELTEGYFGTWQIYQSMARRAQGGSARQLRALAADQQQALRQLSTVYFLLTGEHLHHTAPPISPSGPIDMLLRELFLRESRWRNTFEHLAQETRDLCLKLLFQQMADRAEHHMDAIRRVLEGM